VGNVWGDKKIEIGRVDKLRKNTFKRYLPPIAVDLKNYFISLKNEFFYRDKLKENKVFFKKYIGEDVYVIGNGPSLNNFDLKKIAGKKIISMNHFELHPMKDSFEIVAHCIGEPIDSYSWENPTNMLSNINADSFWFNFNTSKFFESNPINKKIYYYLQGTAFPFFDVKKIDLTKICLPYESTAQMSIAIAIYMGFKNIYLLGFDHDFLAIKNISTHFYEERDGVTLSDWSRLKYIERIKMVLKLFSIYDQLKIIADESSINIVNKSNPSYLDVFKVEL